MTTSYVFKYFTGEDAPEFKHFILELKVSTRLQTYYVYLKTKITEPSFEDLKTEAESQTLDEILTSLDQRIL
jgi:hypothetical protein